MGRYQKDKKSKITLTGNVSGEQKKFGYDAEFSALKNNDFLSHLWATRKIGYLMDEIRLHGENDELKEEIISLSKKYGVMSPYTSFLIQEEDKQMADHFRPVLPMSSGEKGRGLSAEAMDFSGVNISAAPQSMGGVNQVKMSQKVRSMKEAEALSDNSFIKRAGNRSFYWKENFWIDTEYNAEKTIDIKYGSQAYTELILSYPEIAKMASLGEKVIFKFKGKFVKISDNGKKKLSKKELGKLFD